MSREIGRGFTDMDNPFFHATITIIPDRGRVNLWLWDDEDGGHRQVDIPLAHFEALVDDYRKTRSPLDRVLDELPEFIATYGAVTE